MVKIKGIKKVRSRLAGGAVKTYHYAWQGGGAPVFWSSDHAFAEGSPEYIEALAAARSQRTVDRKDQPQKANGPTTHEAIDLYKDSGEFKRKRPRTQADYTKWLDQFAKEFGDDPIRLFEEEDSRGELLDWRDKWSHSPKQMDYAKTVAVGFLNWCRDRKRLIRTHHCDRIGNVYKVDRSEIIWSPADREAFDAIAPGWARRILTAALETGLRPGDLIRLSRSHVEATNAGRRIRIRTSKRGRVASIPVTPRMGNLIDETPHDQMLILTSQRGKPLTEHRASEGVRQWRDKAGLSDALRLQDCRGTAATQLLRANARLSHIASMFGWSLRYAQNVIENYAQVDPDTADEVLVLLNQRENKA